MSTSAMRFLQQENIRLKKETEALEKESQTLYHYLDMIKELYWTGQQIALEENPLDALDQLLYKLIDVIGARDGSLSYLEEESGELVFLIVHGDLGQQLPGYRIKHDVGIAGWVVDNHKPIIVNHPRQDWRFSEEVDQEFSFMTHSIISVPIISGDQLIGVISILNKRNNEFTEADVALLLIFSQVAVTTLGEMKSRLTTSELAKAENSD